MDFLLFSIVANVKEFNSATHPTLTAKQASFRLITGT
jgi:hypothetical protein